MRQLISVNVMVQQESDRPRYYYTIVYANGTVKTRGPYKDHSAMLREIMAELES